MSSANTLPVEVEVECSIHFQALGAEGARVLHDLTANRVYMHASERARRGYLPASTFKILSSLIALETGVLRDEHETIRWDDVDGTGCPQRERVLRPAELLESTDAVIRSVTSSPSDRLRIASETVPWDSVERGIGVIAFGEPRISGAPRIDTLRIRAQPNPAAALQAMVVLDTRGPGGWYTVLAGRDVRRNLVEIAYEEQAVPFDSLTGSWARVVYGRSADGLPLRGWTDTGVGEVRTLSWTHLLLQRELYFPDPSGARFHDAPNGARFDIRLTPPNVAEPDYDLQPIRADGDWMQVRVVVPSTCSGIAPAAEWTAWIRHLDSTGRPLLRARTRGC